jgi:MGT family glycosyltransferase
MAHFAILSPPDAGHLIPLGALGAELMRRGHRVTVVAHDRGAPLIEPLGLPLRELAGDDIPDLEPFFLNLAFRTVGQEWLTDMREWLRWEAEVTLQRVPTILRELAVDGVVSDQIVSAAGTVAEHLGLPFVTVCTAPPWNVDILQPPPFTPWHYAEGPLARWRNRLGYLGWRWFSQPTLKLINHYRKAWELRPYWRIDDSYSPLAQISQLFAELDFPRSAIPPHFHYVGSLAADRPVSDQGFPWERLDGRPLIYASLGTIPDAMNRPVYAKIASACVGLDAQLVMARGKWDDEDTGREFSHELPGDPLVVDFAPQLALLERAAMLITHAGLNTTLEAISRGVPMVAMPRSADQPGNAARIEYSGAGLCASFHRSTPQRLRTVIERVLVENTFRRRAKDLQAAMVAAGGPRRAADIVEESLTTGRPVRREEMNRQIPVLEPATNNR